MPTPTKILVLVLIVAFSQGQPLDIGDNDYGNLTQFPILENHQKCLIGFFFCQIAIFSILDNDQRIFT